MPIEVKPPVSPLTTDEVLRETQWNIDQALNYLRAATGAIQQLKKSQKK